MPRAGAVWVDVLPNMSRFGQQLDREIGEPVAQASARAGAQGGESLVSGMKGKMLAGAAIAGAAAGAVLVKTFETAVAKQKATNTLKAQMDLSTADAKRAGDAAGRMFGSTVTETVDEAAAAVRATMSAGLAPPKATTRQLTEISTKVQDLSTLFEVDLGQAANAAGQAVKTGLAKNSAEALDIMYRGFQIMGPRADDLADTFNEYSTIFRSLGLDMKVTTGLFSQGMKAGARDTDTVADALKEFQIRTTDGSKTSAEGFKLLGMNAKEATAQFAAGGAGAAQGLQQVMDKLRGMKDPVARNAAAVALFGTKAEDLGQALFSLDPSKAVGDLGKVSGAAKRAGDSLRSDAGVPFEQFKRRSLIVLGDVMTRYVFPPLMAFGRFLNTDLKPTLLAVSAGFMTGVKWLREYGAWFAPLAIAIGGVTLAMTANSIATGITMGILGAYSLAIRGAAAVTRGWAAAQALFNAVMALNPITLVIIGVVALGAALVVAYKRSETFRNIVNAAWSGIKAGWDILWNQGLKPGFAGLMTGLRAVGTAATWLWNSVLSPVFSAIGLAARIVATTVGVILVLPTIVALKALGAVGSWLWDVAIGPAFRAIGAGAVWLWQSALKPQLAAVMGGVRMVGDLFGWLWRNAISPAIGAIVGGARLLWAGMKIQFGYVTAGIRALGAAANWLWHNAISPAFKGIGAAASWLYTQGVKVPLDKAKSLAHSLGDAFKTAADAVGKAFHSLREKASTPINFIIGTVYNKGIVPTWNLVAKAFGAPPLKTAKGLARGGILPGQSSFRDGDNQLVPMRDGEGVYVSEAMRDPYERARLHAVNRAAMQGRSLSGFRDGGGGFAEGGIFSWVKNTASKGLDLASAGVDWLKDGVKASAEAGLNAAVQPLISRISGSASLYRDMVSGIPKKMIRSIIGYGGEADAELKKAGVGGRGFTSALAWARTQAGLPYQWGGNGDPSWDCSGFVSAIESVIRGQAPHRRWATGAFSGATAPPGWALGARSPFMIGITNSGVGHTAGTINGVNVESRGGDGVVVGSRARSFMDPLFTHRYGLRGFSGGGRPRNGEVAWVGERGPEIVQFAGGAQVFDARSSARMVQPARVVPVTSSRAPESPLASLDGVSVALVLDDGTALAAHFDTRVDAKLSTARRTARAGTRKG